MGAQRRFGPAAVAAALIGAGLLLHRPRLVSELTAGPRGSARPSATHAAAIAWPPTDPAAAPAAHRAAPASAPDEDARVSAWRDALAERPFSVVERSGAASRPAPRKAGREARTRKPAAPAASGSDADENEEGPGPAGSPREKNGSAARVAPPRAGDPRSASSVPRRTPLALGPAAPDDGDAEDESAVPAAPGRADGRPTGGSWSRRRARFFPLFRPPRPGASRRAGAVARRRARPLLLSRLLGRAALRPPPSSLVPPDLSSLRRRKPARLPDGSPTPVRAYELDLVEAHDPRRSTAADRRRSPHWDTGHRWHDGAALGVAADARWLWLWKEKSRWWAAPEPERPPLVRHGALWWGKQRGVWFALHDGELWSWRRFADWDAEGLIRLTDGVELVYSSDFTKVAVITPGAGAVLYDAATGAELGEWLEHEMPRRRPRAPVDLRLPRGI